MTPEMRAALLRVGAAYLEVTAARLRMAAAATLAAARIAELVRALEAGEARDVARHPDLAELNVQLDAWYPTDAAES